MAGMPSSARPLNGEPGYTSSAICARSRLTNEPVRLKNIYEKQKKYVTQRLCSPRCFSFSLSLCFYLVARKVDFCSPPITRALAAGDLHVGFLCVMQHCGLRHRW